VKGHARIDASAIASTIDAVVREQTVAALFSGVVLVQECGRPAFARAYGLAQRGESLPNTLVTRFATASGSKTFTAVVIGQLVARGLLAFDTPLAACLPTPLPALDLAVTIQQLLTHTAGIPTTSTRPPGATTRPSGTTCRCTGCARPPISSRLKAGVRCGGFRWSGGPYSAIEVAPTICRYQ